MESIKKRTLSVDNMVCEGCEEMIEKEISNLNGVMEVKANHKTEKDNLTEKHSTYCSEPREILEKAGKR